MRRRVAALLLAAALAGVGFVVVRDLRRGYRSTRGAKIERAEAAHGDAADRDPAAVRMCARQRRGDRLAENGGAPAAVAPVVPVAVVAAVGEQDDRRAPTERVQRVEELLS